MRRIYGRIAQSLILVMGMTSMLPAQDGTAATDRSQNEPDRKPATKRQRNKSRGDSPARVLEVRFEREAPQIGDPLPDVTAFDADGNEFHLRSLKGNYTVLVFGCLT